MNHGDIPVFPVARFDFGAVPHLGAFMLRAHYLSSPMQRPQDAQPDRYYALTAVQCRELAQALLQGAQILEKTPEQAPPGPQN